MDFSAFGVLFKEISVEPLFSLMFVSANSNLLGASNPEHRSYNGITFLAVLFVLCAKQLLLQTERRDDQDPSVHQRANTFKLVRGFVLCYWAPQVVLSVYVVYVNPHSSLASHHTFVDPHTQRDSATIDRLLMVLFNLPALAMVSMFVLSVAMSQDTISVPVKGGRDLDNRVVVVVGQAIFGAMAMFHFAASFTEVSVANAFSFISLPAFVLVAAFACFHSTLTNLVDKLLSRRYHERAYVEVLLQVFKIQSSAFVGAIALLLVLFTGDLVLRELPGPLLPTMLHFVQDLSPEFPTGAFRDVTPYTDTLRELTDRRDVVSFLGRYDLFPTPLTRFEALFVDLPENSQAVYDRAVKLNLHPTVSVDEFGKNMTVTIFQNSQKHRGPFMLHCISRRVHATFDYTVFKQMEATRYVCMQLAVLVCVVVAANWYLDWSAKNAIAVSTEDRLIGSQQNAANSDLDKWKRVAEAEGEDCNKNIVKKFMDDPTMDHRTRSFLSQNFTTIQHYKSSKAPDLINVASTVVKLKGVMKRQRGKTNNKTKYPTVDTLRDSLGDQTVHLLSSWEYNSLKYTTEELVDHVQWLFIGSDLLTGHYVLSEKRLKNFASKVAGLYKPNPYHNFAHACDVLQFVCNILRTSDASVWLFPVEVFSLLVSAIGHDLKHPGVNNKFLCSVEEELALTYNDNSPLENLHAATLFQVLREDETNVIDCLTIEEKREARRLIIDCILETDMIHHFELISKLQVLQELYTPPDSSTSKYSSLKVEGLSNTARIAYLAGTPEHPGGHRGLLMKTILHCADIGNPARNTEISVEWSRLVMQEFFEQGDVERKQGFPVSPFFDRNSTNIPQVQFNFICYVVKPLHAEFLKIFPSCSVLGDNLVSNANHWLSEYEESDPESRLLETMHRQTIEIEKTICDAYSRFS